MSAMSSFVVRGRVGSGKGLNGRRAGRGLGLGLGLDVGVEDDKDGSGPEEAVGLDLRFRRDGVEV